MTQHVIISISSNYMHVSHHALYVFDTEKNKEGPLV